MTRVEVSVLLLFKNIKSTYYVSVTSLLAMYIMLTLKGHFIAENVIVTFHKISICFTFHFHLLKRKHICDRHIVFQSFIWFNGIQLPKIAPIISQIIRTKLKKNFFCVICIISFTFNIDFFSI